MASAAAAAAAGGGASAAAAIRVSSASLSFPGRLSLLGQPPDLADVRFLVHNEMEQFEASPHFHDVSAIVFVAAGGKVELVPDIFDALGQNVRWVHSFFAGVDALAPFIASHLQPRQLRPSASGAIPFTNGRGAFSSSLAEHIMASALHFNKKISRCQQNVRDKKWDKFVMPTLSGKTIGFVGFGHIQTSQGLQRHSV